MGSEAIAPALSKFLFGKKPNELSQEQKDTITSILNLTTAITAYSTTGGSVADAVNGAEIGRVGVENNRTASEVLFALQNPIIASRIGVVASDKDLHKIQNPNISTIVATFQVNLINKNAQNLDGVTGEGGIANAYRHALWQTIISNEFGSKIATQVGNVHEASYTDQHVNSPTYGGLYLDQVFYSSRANADEVVDQFNNQVGRNIYAKSPGLQNKDYAKLVLDHYYNNGLYQVLKSGDSYHIEVVRLPQEIYNKAVQSIASLDNTGAGPSLQKRRLQYRQNSIMGSR
ncbi:VENN motif pre-toxin domain-containing protein [Moraxella cuniculi]|uniref:Possible hemagglutinin (DUF638) n=1 Tax=Moraxella cuniculi TaxID=34061 RepID=A0A3S4SDG6_9GAMM|nr:VENN motif pre-toxin domain-containing protein [Moraxella cuniculi]VEG13729.1 Possible hemagglutinin (DUF638) [Moraxella cuniculi]